SIVRSAGSTRVDRRLSGGSLRPFELELPELDAADLAGERLRQVAHELDTPWICVRRQALADERLDVVREPLRRLVVRGAHDERLDDVAAQLVRRGDRSCLLYRRMLQADGLD